MALFSTAAGVALFGIFAAAARPDNPAPGDSVGAIEGEAIAVTGPMTNLALALKWSRPWRGAWARWP